MSIFPSAYLGVGDKIWFGDQTIPDQLDDVYFKRMWTKRLHSKRDGHLINALYLVFPLFFKNFFLCSVSEGDNWDEK